MELLHEDKLRKKTILSAYIYYICLFVWMNRAMSKKLKIKAVKLSKWFLYAIPMTRLFYILSVKSTIPSDNALNLLLILESYSNLQFYRVIIVTLYLSRVICRFVFMSAVIADNIMAADSIFGLECPLNYTHVMITIRFKCHILQQSTLQLYYSAKYLTFHLSHPLPAKNDKIIFNLTTLQSHTNTISSYNFILKLFFK